MQTLDQHIQNVQGGNFADFFLDWQGEIDQNPRYAAYRAECEKLRQEMPQNNSTTYAHNQYRDSLSTFINKIKIISEKGENFTDHPLFEVFPIGQITPKDFFNNPTRTELRNGFFEFAYIDTFKHDDEIEKNLKEKKHFLVRGTALAGKTRSVWHWLNVISQEEGWKNTYVLKLKPYWKVENSLDLPTNLRLLVWFDDLHNFFTEESRLPEYLRLFDALFAMPNVQIVTTCRDGQEWDTLARNEQVQKRVLERLELIDIQEFIGVPEDKKEEKGYMFWAVIKVRFQNWYKQQTDKKSKEEALEGFQKINAQNYNGSMGSLFLGLHEIRNRYKKYEPDSEERCVLFVLKCLFEADFHFNMLFLVEKVQNMVEKLLDRKFAFGKFEKLLSKMENEYFLLFLSARNRIRIDEVYLEQVITDFSIEKIIQTLVSTAEDDTEKSTRFNRLIQKNSTNFSTIQSYGKILQKYADPFTTTALLKKGKNLAEKKAIFGFIEEKKLPKNNVAYHDLMQASTEFAEVWTWFEKMEKAGVTADHFTKSILFKKANQTQKEQIKQKFESLGIKDDLHTYNQAIENASNFEQANAILKEMKELGLKPDEISYNTLINKSPDFAQTKHFFEEMKREIPLQKNPESEYNYTVAYNTLINKSPDFQTAEGFLKEMKEWGLKPDEYSYNTLINKSPNFQTAEGFLKEMKDWGLKPNEISYTTLINKSLTFAQARHFFEEMKKQVPLQKNPESEYNYTVAYSTLINKSSDFQTAEGFLKEMKELGLKPNEISYSTLINKSPDFKTAQIYFLKFLVLFPFRKEKNERNYNYLFTVFLKNVQTADQWLWAKNELDKCLLAGFQPNDYTEAAIRKAEKR